MTTLSEHKNIKKILIVSTSWLGDAIITIPTIHGIRNLYPDARISILAKNTIADIFRTVDILDEVIYFQKEKGLKKALGVFKIASALKKKKFDLAFIFPRSLGSALMCFLAGIPERIGFASNARDLFLTESVQRDTEILSKHQVHYYKKLLLSKGVSDFPELPCIKTPKRETKWAQKFILALKNPEKPFLVGINPGSTYGEAKQWLPERFEELAKRLVKNNGCDIIIFGDANSTPLAEKINRGIENKAIDVTGKTNILQLTGLLKECDLLVTNDTGPMHLACAVKTQVVAVYGSTNQITTSPLGPDAVMIKTNMPCSPCMKRVCPEGHHLCMKNISVDEIQEAVLQKLSALKKQ